MKKILLPVVLMFLAGCDYEVPLSQTASAPANPALAGTWVGQEPKDIENGSMEIKISGTDYYVTYGASSNALYFKGFEIKAAGLNLIQLELQGADEQNEKNKYLFVKYELTLKGLSFCRLDTKVVSDKCQSTEELLSDLTVHRKNPFLFTEPLKFTKSTPQ
jgi:hypothetical protein